MQCDLWLEKSNAKGTQAILVHCVGEGRKNVGTGEGRTVICPSGNNMATACMNPFSGTMLAGGIAARETATSVHSECVLQMVLEVLPQDTRDWGFPFGSPSLNPSD